MLDRHALKALLTAVGQRDRIAFRKVYDDRAGALLALGLRITGQKSLADEAVGQTFVDLWRHCVDGKIAAWETPDLKLAQMCRVNAMAITARSDERPEQSSDTFEMTDPIADGTASTDLLVLLQAFGKMSETCRDAVVTGYFEPASREHSAQRLSLEPDRLDECVRRCYSELQATTGMTPHSDDREADISGLAHALGIGAGSRSSTVDELRDAWEERLAPLHQLLVPLEADDAAFADIASRIDADVNTLATVQGTKSTDTWRAVLFAGIAILAAIAIVVVIIALTEDAPAAELHTDSLTTEETTDD
ncbi:MAG: hypothetical protein AAGD13_13455 [Pseudomonadota bacterium]